MLKSVADVGRLAISVKGKLLWRTVNIEQKRRHTGKRKWYAAVWPPAARVVAPTLIPSAIVV